MRETITMSTTSRMFRTSVLSVATCAAFAVATLVAPGARAQDMNQAVEAYSSNDYESAATLFYAVIQFSDSEGDIAEAQYGLAKSLQELGLYFSSFLYYREIVSVGADHPYFDKGVEGLIGIPALLKDDLLIPPVLDGMYDTNFSAVSKMGEELKQQLHFAIGRYTFERGNIRDARDFLKTVKEGNPAYAQAQYLLGLIRLGIGRLDAPKPKYDEAFAHFENVRRVISEDTADPDKRELRDLATMGVARVYYEKAYLLDEGDPEREIGLRRSIYEYRTIPRFSEAWADALFERAWAHTVYAEYGKALGAMHSLNSPYFTEYFYPEADTLRAIIYYYNCQWDRVNAVLDNIKGTYTPMVEQMQSILEVDYQFDEWYLLLQKSLEKGPGHTEKDFIPYPIAKQVTRDPKFQKMEAYLQQLEKELKAFQENDAFSGEMGSQLAEQAGENRDNFLKVLGKYVNTKLKDNTAELSDITTRASLISLETKTAETEWLELGKTLKPPSRDVLPRRWIPYDSFEFWWFRGEYWIDELGYYEYQVQTECY